MKNFPVALKAELINPATWVAWVMTSLIVGISGPFDSFATVEFPTRLWGWALLIGLGLLGGVVLRTFVRTALEITDFLRCSFMTATMVAACCPRRYLNWRSICSPNISSSPHPSFR